VTLTFSPVLATQIRTSPPVDIVGKQPYILMSDWCRMMMELDRTVSDACINNSAHLETFLGNATRQSDLDARRQDVLRAQNRDDFVSSNPTQTPAMCVILCTPIMLQFPIFGIFVCATPKSAHNSFHCPALRYQALYKNAPTSYKGT
jgi:hypothetical protein